MATHMYTFFEFDIKRILLKNSKMYPDDNIQHINVQKTFYTSKAI